MDNESQIVDAGITGFQEAVTYAGLVYFDSDEVLAGMFDRLLNECLSIAEANFQNHRCSASKECLQVQQIVPVLEPERGPKFFQCFLLGGGLPAGSPHEAADGSSIVRIFGHMGLFVLASTCIQQYAGQYFKKNRGELT